MATAEQEKPRKKRKRIPINDNGRDAELTKVKAWRKERFTSVLKENGLDDEQIAPVIDALVDSESSAHDLEHLLVKGCNPETAIRIVA